MFLRRLSAGFFFASIGSRFVICFHFRLTSAKIFLRQSIDFDLLFLLWKKPAQKWSKQIWIIIGNWKNANRNIVTGRLLQIFLKKKSLRPKYAWLRTPKNRSETQLENIGLISPRLWQPSQVHLAMEQDRLENSGNCHVETFAYRELLSEYYLHLWGQWKRTQEMYSKINPLAAPAILVETVLVKDGLSKQFKHKHKRHDLPISKRSWASFPPGPLWRRCACWLWAVGLLLLLAHLLLLVEPPVGAVAAFGGASSHAAGTEFCFSVLIRLKKWCCCCCCACCCRQWSFFFCSAGVRKARGCQCKAATGASCAAGVGTDVVLVAVEQRIWSL